MKKYIILIFTIILCAICTFGQERHDGHKCHDRYETNRHHLPAYFISDNEVFFQGQRIKDASASSFDILGDGYAKDNWNVYYCGHKINDASSHSFKVLNYGYAKDNWNVYYNGVKIEARFIQLIHSADRLVRKRQLERVLRRCENTRSVAKQLQGAP